MKKPKTYKVTLEFDNKNSAHYFFAHWLDGGADGGGNIDWNTTKWKGYNYMRIEGSGYNIDHDGVILTPEIAQLRRNEQIKKLRGK